MDGHLSQPNKLFQGLPQGSNISPLLYILYTSDIPDLCHSHPVSVSSPATGCVQCGSTVSYIDDNSYSVGCENAEELTEKLTEEYQRISDYMASNRLVINDSKIKLVVFGNKQIGNQRDDVTIKAGAHTIKPVASHKLLGAVISQSLRWSDHLINHEQSLLKQLRTRLNGVSLISRTQASRPN